MMVGGGGCRGGVDVVLLVMLTAQPKASTD